MHVYLVRFHITAPPYMPPHQIPKAVDYRLAPETVFPGQLHDVVSTYFRLTDDLRVPPENLVVAGDSAGGALGLALLFYLRDNGYTLPGGALLFSPWVGMCR